MLKCIFKFYPEIKGYERKTKKRFEINVSI